MRFSLDIETRKKINQLDFGESARSSQQKKNSKQIPFPIDMFVLAGKDTKSTS